MGRKYVISLILSFVLIQMIASVAIAEYNNLTKADIEGKTAVLIEMNSGEVLYNKNMNQKMHPASTTKIMTGLLLIENASLREQVTVSTNAFGTSGSSMFLDHNEEISVRNLLYGLMVSSANDGAIAVAEHIAGSVDIFTDLMNQRAKELGAMNTNFVNPHGLSEDEHKTTAYDLAAITREALQNPKFRRVVSTLTTTIPWPGNDEDRLLVNRNKLLRDYKGAIGVKTGYTRRANQTLVAAAERKGMTLIAVVLSSSRDRIFEDAANLLDYGFDNYMNAEVLEQDELVDFVEVHNSNQEAKLLTKHSVELPIPKHVTEIEKKLELSKPLEAPIEKGKEVGALKLLLEDEEITAIPVYVSEHIEQSLASRLWFRISVGSGLLLVGLLIIKRAKVISSSRSTKEKLRKRYR